MSDKEVVRLEDVWVQYNGVPILEGINLAIEQDDFLGIIGPRRDEPASALGDHYGSRQEDPIKGYA